MQGTMLWFNAANDCGALQAEDGERIDVPGDAFAPGERPVERCAGKAVTFEWREGTLSGVVFVPQVSPRRARLRHRR